MLKPLFPQERGQNRYNQRGGRLGKDREPLIYQVQLKKVNA